ncbi:MAG: glycosyltransferase family 4 protein [Desulfobacterales bacterium]|nr:MAG: glycosyltransferase family 4 protein [Desulfobacterales bacterium]
MRIAAGPALGMILKGYPRISEAFISNEILLLERLGFAIHLFSMRQPRESFSHASVQRIRAEVDYLPETLLAPLPRLLYHNGLLAAQKPQAYAAALKAACRRYLRTHKTATIKHLLQAGYLVHKLLPQRPVTHFHAHFAHSPASVAMFASQLSGRPFSFTAHAKDIYTSDARQLREKIAQARFVVTCTEYNRRYLSDMADGGSTPIYRIYHGIDTRLFSGKDTFKQTPRAPYQILSVARLTAKKGLPTVYRALKLLWEGGLVFEHVLIGDGDDRQEILSLIQELGLQSVTRWLGTQPHHVVLEHYRRADLFVLGCEVAPNGDRDGIPNVLLESMAMGVPVVATAVSAIPELVENEKTGLLVPPGQPERLAQAMQRLLTDENLRNRVIPAARRRVVRDFDNEFLIGALADVYRRQRSGHPAWAEGREQGV